MFRAYDTLRKMASPDTDPNIVAVTEQKDAV